MGTLTSIPPCSLFSMQFFSPFSLQMIIGSHLVLLKLAQLGLQKLKNDFVIFRYIENWLAWEILTFLNNHLWHPIYPFSQDAWSSQTDSKPKQTYNNQSWIEGKSYAVRLWTYIYFASRHLFSKQPPVASWNGLVPFFQFKTFICEEVAQMLSIFEERICSLNCFSWPTSWIGLALLAFNLNSI